MRVPLSWLRDFAAIERDPDELADGVLQPRPGRRGRRRGRRAASTASSWPGSSPSGPIPTPTRSSWSTSTPATAARCRSSAAPSTSRSATWSRWPRSAPSCPAAWRSAGARCGASGPTGCCARPAELGLPEPADAADGILVLPPGGGRAGHAAGRGARLGAADVVFDLDISPNRPDALCMAGVARDLAAALGEPWRRPSVPPPVAVDASLGIASVVVEAGDLCPRFTATILEGVPEGPSPAWMGRRLTLAGMRPISVVVDVSNYVMLDVGQPNHAYDLGQLGGDGLLIRRARAGETLVTLDGVSRLLEADDCVICRRPRVWPSDRRHHGRRPGGDRAGDSARSCSRRPGLPPWPSPARQSGSGVALRGQGPIRARRGPGGRRGGGRPLCRAARRRRPSGPTVDVRDAAHLPPATQVRVRTERVNAILGTGHRRRRGGSSAGADRVWAPAGRSGRADRHHPVLAAGHRARDRRHRGGRPHVRLPAGRARTVPPGSRAGPSVSRTANRTAAWSARSWPAPATTRLGPPPSSPPATWSEPVLTAAAVEVENPLDSSESVLRTSLLPGLLKAVRANVDRQDADVRLFEIGHVFDLPRRDRSCRSRPKCSG